MNFLKKIFLKIADKLGLKMQEKNISGTDDYSDSSKISFTAAIAQRVATITMQDSGANIAGENARAKYLDELLQGFVNTRLSAAAEVALGTGDCLIKPYTDGKRIGFDIIKNEDFVICESIGDFIKSVLIRADTIRMEGNVYQRVEANELIESETGTDVRIRQFAFLNGNEVPLATVPAWEQLEPERIITNMDRLPFGRIKCPTVNRENINGTNGVKITYGLDDILNKTAEAYDRYTDEFEKKESFVFVDKTILQPASEKAEGARIPERRKRIFQMMTGYGDDGGEKIKEYSPQIREAEMQSGLDVNFRMLELFTGLSHGILTSPETKFATATEMKASLQATYAFITRFRKSIVGGVEDLFNAVDVFCDLNRTTPAGKWEITFDWSSAYIENMSEHFAQLMQAEAIGAASKAEVRSYVLDEDLQVAEEKVAEIAESNVEEI